MPRKAGYLDRLQIPSPCPADWDRMVGNDQVRFCGECNKNVYNLSKMTRDQAEALVSRSKGQLCARFYRQEDGVILTEEKSAGLRLISRRASPIAAAVVSAILGLGGSAQTIPGAGRPSPVHSESESKKANPEPGTHLNTSSLTGTIFDSQEAVVPGATVTLTQVATGNVYTQVSSQEGLYRFAALEAGAYTMRVICAGFSIFMNSDINLKTNEELRSDVTMKAALLMGGAIAVAVLPLRSLYEQSDLVVVARVGKSKQQAHKDGNALITTKLQVSSVIKGGENKSTVEVYHWGWGEEKNFPGDLKEGDTALMFLDKSEKGKGFELLEPDYAVKKLSDADLKTYLKRIDELTVILREEKAKPEAITEWLVRCAEESATRWEGASELSWDTESLSQPEEEGDQQEADAEVAEAVEPDEPAVDEGEEAAEPPDASADENGEPNFAALLTEEQKARLSAALYNIEAITERDIPLVELVRTWENARLLSFLLSQLRRMESDPPPIAESLVRLAAEFLNDEEARALARQYSDEASYDDEKADERAGEAGAREAAPSAADNRRLMLRQFLAFVEGKSKP